MGQRFLYVNVLAEGHGFGGDDTVGVVGGSHQHGVDALAHVVEHLTVIPVPFGFRIAVESSFRILPVHVAQGHDVLRFHVRQVGCAHAADTDGRDVQFVARGGLSGRFTENGTRNDGQSGQADCARAQKVSPGYFFCHKI